MLSRTADGLYWLARYAERADSTGRLLMMGRKLAMLPDGVSGDDRRSVLRVTASESFVTADAEVSECDAVAQNKATFSVGVGYFDGLAISQFDYVTRSGCRT